MPERKVSQKVSFSGLTAPTLDEIRRSEDSSPNDNKFKGNELSLDVPKLYDDVRTQPNETSDDSDGEENYVGTYVSRYANTLSHGTEALPRMDNFRNLHSLHAKARPTIDELHGHNNQDTYFEPKKAAHTVHPEDAPPLKGKVIKFSWLEGVLMRCLLNIWGVMLFIRLSWVVGQGGIIQGLLAITWANVTTFITAISMSAVSTNGQIKGGGIYYMISRSLGPEFGAAIGLLFTIANSVAVALHIVGFCESMLDLLRTNNVGQIVDGGVNDTRIIGCIVLVAILILVFVGMDWVTRTQMLMLVILIAAQVDFIVGSIIGPINDEERARGFIGYNLETLKTNLYPDYGPGLGDDTSVHDFFSVFGVFFPAVTGIVAGANLSGDLKDPASAIPKGTLLAIAITYGSYIIYGVMMGACALREASGNVTQYLDPGNYTGFISYTDCPTLESCPYGLLRSAQVMELISSWGPLIYMGAFAASLSSAIASLVGAPRVLQALARDKLYPKIEFFAHGYGANNDPVRGYILVFCVSLGCVLIADLDAIAPMLSTIFLAAYCLINFSCFHATITKSPGWRPSFKYYNAWVSLLGSVLCITAMFLMNWVTGLITLAITLLLYLYVTYRGPDVNWGSSTQAQSYNSALASVIGLQKVEEHTKNYRPQILVLSGFPSSRPAIVDFAHLLVKNISLMICGHVLTVQAHQKARNMLTRHANDSLTLQKKKGFYTLIEAGNVHQGAYSLMQAVGLGKLRPNMVLMGYKQNWNTCQKEELSQYFALINDSLGMHLAVGILRVEGGLDISSEIEDEGQLTLRRIFEVQRKLLDVPKIVQNGYDDVVIDQARESMDREESPPPVEDEVPSTVNELQVPGNSKLSETKKKKRKISASLIYPGLNGTKLPIEKLNKITQFQRKQTTGVIDVYWLYDDGGLTLLLPYILTLRSQYAECKLRIFSLSSKKDELGQEQRNMAALLSKLRIEFSDVVVIPDINKKAEEGTKKEFDTLIEPLMYTSIFDSELIAVREKTNRHLRLRELLLQYSKDSTLIVMTLMVPKADSISAAVYMAWLEMMSRGMPPFLFVRGNQTSVLTFYA